MQTFNTLSAISHTRPVLLFALGQLGMMMMLLTTTTHDGQSTGRTMSIGSFTVRSCLNGTNERRRCRRERAVEMEMQMKTIVNHLPCLSGHRPETETACERNGSHCRCCCPKKGVSVERRPLCNRQYFDFQVQPLHS